MLIPVADLIGHPGATRDLHRALAVEEVGDDPWGPAEGALLGAFELTLGLDSVVEGIWMHGDVSWQLELQCGRCLRDVVLARTSEVGELFVDTARVEHLDDDVDDDVDDGYVIHTDSSSIDLERFLHDLVILDLPTAVRCEREDCAVPAVDVEGVAVFTEDQVAEAPDPRWAALANLNLSES